ncbi:tetratricopeptide repeat protein [Luteibacter rhizovicinus]|uniref:tetratricopeptide repeat protein n=1 Tax=Luteibacter rhizovicinus TaxID=242606 RepID=UPI000F76FEE0|nr:tetratricopeptide repeat protein [Luteibacter rhizovicinus]
MRIDRSLALLFAGILASLIATLLIYSQGLQGDFLFDDWANLPALGAQGPVDHWPAFLRYITSGTADPTGRPLALLSFLLDAHHWPASPAPFKRTNLLIHLINGSLLSGLLWRLGGVLQLPRRDRAMSAWFGGTVWMLHPLFASTVLYIVQREAMLPATFTLLGIHAWLSGRHRYAQADGGRAWVVGGISMFTVLAFLSKANGVLLPLLVLIIEACLPPLAGNARSYRRWLLSTCVPWIVAVVLGLLWFAGRGIDNASPSYRGWSVGQRLLTEPTIIWTYVGQLALVVRIAGSVFHDQYPAANSLFDPLWTLPAIAALGIVIFLGWRYRKRYPALAMAVLFYLAAHLVESTSIPLELYFEHRNYLPALLLFWPLGLALSRLRYRLGAIAIGVLLSVGVGTITLGVTKLWGNPVAQASMWAEDAPGSARAQTYAAQMEGEAGHPRRGLQRLALHRSEFAAEPQVALAILDLRCQLGDVDAADIAFAGTSLQIAPRDPGKLVLNWFSPAIAVARSGTCHGLDAATLERMLDRAATNPHVVALPGRMQDIEHLRGELALARGDTTAARAHFDTALRLLPAANVALEQAASLGRANAPDLAIGHLDVYAQLTPPAMRSPSTGMAWVHDQVLSHQDYWNNELVHLRSALSNASKESSQ